MFTEGYRSHGYPITREKCEEVNLPVKKPSKEIQETFYKLHETYFDMLISKERGLIIHSENHLNVTLAGEDITDQVEIK